MENLIIALTLAVLACFRLARLFVKDDGPANIFLRLRVRVGVYDLGENLQPQSITGKLFACQHCLGVWVALPVTWLAFGIRPLSEWVLLWLAVAGGQSLLFGWSER